MNEFLPVDHDQFYKLPPTREQYQAIKRQRNIALIVAVVMCGVVLWLIGGGQ